MAQCLRLAPIRAPCPAVCCVFAGHPEERAAACVGSLRYDDDDTAGHVEYPLYYYNDKMLLRARQIFAMDVSAFGYSFNTSLALPPWVKGSVQPGSHQGH